MVSGPSRFCLVQQGGESHLWQQGHRFSQEYCAWCLGLLSLWAHVDADVERSLRYPEVRLIGTVGLTNFIHEKDYKSGSKLEG